mgnify:CR=1 FL=1
MNSSSKATTRSSASDARRIWSIRSRCWARWSTPVIRSCPNRSPTTPSWSTPADVNSVRISYGGISFNVDSKLTIMGYRQDSPLGGFVTPLSLSTLSDPLAIGSNYFVQDDGSLATTSSSTKAGKAISTTALNLVDPT